MTDVWWEARGFSDVVTKTGDTFRGMSSVLVEVTDDCSVAYAEAIYTLALKGLETRDNIRSVTAGVSRLEKRDELPTTYYMGVLKENFERKGLVDCAHELAVYAQHQMPEIREIATGLFSDVVDDLPQLGGWHDVVENWFNRDAPEGEPFDGFRLQIATNKGESL